MNLLENLLNNGVTFNVANVKKGDIADKAITMSMPANKVEVTTDYHIKFTRKGDKQLFTVSSNLLELMPTLADKGVGFKPYLMDAAYVLFCNDTQDIKPVMYSVKKGETKTPTFKADAFVYVLENANLITKEEGEWRFNLEECGEDNPGLYRVVDATVELTLKGDLASELISEGVEPITVEEDMEPVATAVAPSFVYEAPVEEEIEIVNEF